MKLPSENKSDKNITKTFWLAGALFTMGMLIAQQTDILSTIKWFQWIGVILLDYLAWPLLLGMEAFGG